MPAKKHFFYSLFSLLLILLLLLLTKSHPERKLELNTPNTENTPGIPTTPLAKAVDKILPPEKNPFIPKPPVLTQLQVFPIHMTLNTGQKGKFMLTGVYSNGELKTLTQGIEWVSDNPNLLSIDANGWATSHMVAGTVNVYARMAGLVSNQAAVRINPTLMKLIIHPNFDTNHVLAGSPYLFQASGDYSDQSHKTLTQEVRWRSSNTMLAKVDSHGNLKTKKGKLGTVKISASQDGISSNEILLNLVG